MSHFPASFRGLKYWVRRRSSERRLSPLAPTSPLSSKTLGLLLRDLGKNTLDVGEQDSKTVRQEYRKWATEILGDQPGADAPVDTGNNTKTDWRGLRRFVYGTVRGQAGAVRRSFEELRNAIWSTVRKLNREIAEDQKADEQVFGQLQRLESAARGDSLREIKQEAQAAVKVIGDLVRTRQQRQRQREYLKVLNTELESMREELTRAREEMAIDSLTRLFNRSSFDQQLERITELTLFAGQPACVVMADIDHFKSVNDDHGHQAGDAVLRQVADTCVKNFPRKTDFVARYGGEEIVMILQDITEADAERLCTRLLKKVRGLRVPVDARDIAVTISLGVSEFVPGDTPETWLRRADEALYAAKDGGRDRVVVK
jgi:diguanylate cyclase (GGDEF)-like protein